MRTSKFYPANFNTKILISLDRIIILIFTFDGFELTGPFNSQMTHLN